MSDPLSPFKRIAKQVNDWNDANQVGVVVEYREVLDQVEPPLLTRTRSEAWILSGHSAVVLLEGKTGCVQLDHVHLAPERAGELEARRAEQRAALDAKAQAQRAVSAWNNSVPPGTAVLRLGPDGASVPGRTASRAFVGSSGAAAVRLEDCGDEVAIETLSIAAAGGGA